MCNCGKKLRYIILKYKLLNDFSLTICITCYSCILIYVYKYIHLYLYKKFPRIYVRNLTKVTTVTSEE